MKKLYLLLISIYLASCASSKISQTQEQKMESSIDSSFVVTEKFENLGNKMIVTQEKTFTIDAGLPTASEWKAERTTIVNSMKKDIEKLESSQTRNKWMYYGLGIAGLTIGTGGGIIGIASEDKTSVASITSLIVGGVTAVLTFLNPKDDLHKVENCLSTYREALRKFEFSWPAMSPPEDLEEYVKYKEATQQLNNEIARANCYPLL